MEAMAGWVVLGSLVLVLIGAYGLCRLVDWGARRLRERQRRRARSTRLELTRWVEGRK